ncbi:MAG: acyloxyacyl hydrolase [Bacteroidota bacterium]|nr:acyloxyacyl hydrolase [Bacteroidota bacterium]MCA6443343.1 acyloxyacyl hydrolase [Bacteroidota bacterium]
MGSIFGQNGLFEHPNWHIKTAYNQGIVLVHRSSINSLVEGYPAIYEINFIKPTLGNKIWQQENNLPDVGITAQLVDFKNPQHLGYGLVAAPFIEIPLNKLERSRRLHMRICWGIAYLTKPFDVHGNQKNLAIGSALNQYVQFRWFWKLKLGQALVAEPGISFSHASNARAKVPNLGLNILTVHTALNFKLPTKRLVPQNLKQDSSTKAKTKNEIVSFISVGFNQREVNLKKEMCYMWAAYYQRNVRNTHKFGLGLNVFYDENYLTDYENSNLDPNNTIAKSRMSLNFVYAYNIGRISIPTEIGYYFLAKAEADGPVVTRISVNYYAKNGLFVHAGLRTHFAIAYNFEYGLGYRMYL